MNLFNLKKNTIAGYKTMIELTHFRKNDNYITVEYKIGKEDRTVVLSRVEDRAFFESHGLVVCDTLVDEKGDFIMDVVPDWQGLNKESKLIEVAACVEWDRPIKNIKNAFDKATSFPLLVLSL